MGVGMGAGVGLGVVVGKVMRGFFSWPYCVETFIGNLVSSH